MAISDVTMSGGVLYPSLSGENAIHSLHQGAGLQKEGQSIDVYRGDDLVSVRSIPKPTVIKMDIEGAEFRALDGMRELLSEPQCRLLFLEVHPIELPEFGASIDDVDRLLKDVGFDKPEIVSRGSELHYFCLKT